MRKSLGWACATILSGGAAWAAPEAADLGKAIGMTIAASGEVENMCGEAVTTSVIPIDFGGAVGTAYLLLIPGGPNTAACYGDVPGDMYLLAAEGTGFRKVFAGGGYISVLPSVTDGVHDFALGGPGFSFPLFVWNGAEFVQQGEMSNDQLSAQGALATYP